MTTVVEQEAEVAEAPALPDLTGHDRCDRCGAQAYVRVILFSMNDLLFCGHHWGKHEAAIDEHILRIKDQRSALDTSVPEA